MEKSEEEVIILKQKWKSILEEMHTVIDEGGLHIC